MLFVELPLVVEEKTHATEIQRTMLCRPHTQLFEIFGRIMPVEEMLVELRAVDVAAARDAGTAMLGGPRAIASIGGKLALAA